MIPTVQWNRFLQVVVGKQGQGLLVENLRIQIEVVKTIEAAPNTALIKIYNLHPDNETKIKNEFDEILINAGYQNSARLVFRGNIKHVFRYRDKTNYITEVQAADGDRDYRTSIVNQSFAAGTTASQIIDKVIGSFSTTVKGFVDVPSRPHIRGHVVSGNSRDILTNISRDTGANWSIQDGQLTIVKSDSVLPDEAIVVNSNTGMLSAPEVNDKGIAVKCLLNPQFRINGTIKLNNNDIRIREHRVPTLSSRSIEQIQKHQNPVRLDPDGIYKIIKLTHKGDNRGPDFYSEVECIGLSAPIPQRSDPMDSFGDVGGII